MDAILPMAIVESRPAGRHVDVEHIWKAYRADNYVVRDVSFTLQPGEFLTLLGPSGSGKTSTLMMVAGFEIPSEGASSSTARMSPTFRRNDAISAWCSRATRCSRT